MQTVYIAAPYAPVPALGLTVAENVVRARALLQHALACGMAPIMVHDSAFADTYGSDADPVIRARGLRVAAAIACAIAYAGGEFWVLEAGGKLTTGCQYEFDAVRECVLRPGVPRPTIRRFRVATVDHTRSHAPPLSFTEVPSP